MHGLVFISASFQQTVKTLAYTHRLIDRELLLDGDMHTHMQKRIGIPHFWRVILVAITFNIIEYSVVFRVQQDYPQRHILHPREHFPMAVLMPGIEEELASLIS